jgi:hypothetical protein
MPTDQQDEKATHDPAKWLVATEIAKFEGDWSGEQIDAGEAPEPFEVLRDEGNLLVIGGVSLLWELAIGNRAAGALEYLNNANARIGVGTSSTAEVDANQAWNEWGIDNTTRLLNRKVAANGTKASGQTWQFTVTVTIA